MAVLDRLWQTAPPPYGHQATQARLRAATTPPRSLSPPPPYPPPRPPRTPPQRQRPPPRRHGLHAVDAAVAPAWPRRRGGRGRPPRCRAPHARRRGEERHGRRGRTRLVRRGHPSFRGTLPRAALAHPSALNAAIRSAAVRRASAPTARGRNAAAVSGVGGCPPAAQTLRPPTKAMNTGDGRRRRRRVTNGQIGWPAGSPTTTREPPGDQPLVASPPPTLGRPLASSSSCGRRLGTRRLLNRAEAGVGTRRGVRAAHGNPHTLEDYG